MKLPFQIPALNRNWLMLVGAIALGLVATGLSYKYLRDKTASLEAEARGAHKMVTVVVAKQDLPRGAVIQAAAFATRKIPAEYVHASSIDPRRFGQVVGQKLAAPLKGGEVLLQVHLESNVAVFSSTLENGNRALTTEVDEVNSISGLLRPGDHIDLMATAHGSGNNSAEETFSLLSNVAVLATGQITRKGEGAKSSKIFTTITMSVSAADAARVIVAKGAGKLTAVLRSPEDAQANATPTMTIDDLLPKKTVVKRRKPASHELLVQYIIGGR